MAGWRDNLLEAALDGVPFFYDEAETKVGRRVEVHEFPGRDEPFAEDLGRTARKWSLRAYVLGENYAATRDELIDLIERGGPHTLTHPYRGDVTVRIVGEVTFAERTDEGRYCTFDLAFVEAGVDDVLVVAAVTPAVIKALSAEALYALAESTTIPEPSNLLAEAAGAVADAVNAAASAVRKVNGKIAAALDLIDDVTAAVDAFGDEVASLLGTPQDLVTKLVALYDACFGLLRDFAPPAVAIGMREQWRDMLDVAMRSLRSLVDFEPEASAPASGTAQSDAEVEVLAAVQATVRGGALAAAVATLVTLQPDSADQAQAVADELAGYFDLVLDAPLDVHVQGIFATLKAKTVEHFVELGKRLPVLSAFTPSQTMPALVIAHALYGDADREDDIVRRNGIRHPLFVAGGLDLEVLADG